MAKTLARTFERAMAAVSKSSTTRTPGDIAGFDDEHADKLVDADIAAAHEADVKGAKASAKGESAKLTVARGYGSSQQLARLHVARVRKNPFPEGTAIYTPPDLKNRPTSP
ncbi:hypothetical protein [Burkholderia humptydooensis]|uniref:hypothetical protein n=1 Tax=Burkholderia humptydooensis TaxID=430531 RepID=UPI0009E1D5C1|nr:hypothetical protein [Burkholderia humptydooensis]